MVQVTAELRDALNALRDQWAPDLDLRFAVSEDSTGDPAIWIWVIFDETLPAWERRKDLRNEIVHALDGAHSDLWPYIRFRSREDDRAEGEGANGAESSGSDE